MREISEEPNLLQFRNRRDIQSLGLEIPKWSESLFDAPLDSTYATEIMNMQSLSPVAQSRILERGPRQYHCPPEPVVYRYDNVLWISSDVWRNPKLKRVFAQ